jgi:hypothetical protein
MKILRMGAALLSAVLVWCGAGAAQAALPVAGWGYSVGNAIWGIAPWHGDGAGWWDPPASQPILRGRITLQFDPAMYQIDAYGWFGDFAVDPSTLAPPVIYGPPDAAWKSTFVLQGPNPGMTANVAVDNTAGFMVVDFDWGPGGYVAPSQNHFNFFGYFYSIPNGMTDAQLAAATSGPYGPGKIVMVGSPLDVALNGVNASTFMLCGGGFCGVPEPSTWSTMILGLGGVGAVMRRRRSLFRPA